MFTDHKMSRIKRHDQRQEGNKQPAEADLYKAQCDKHG